MTRLLRRTSRAAFYGLLFLMPVSLRWFVIQRNAYGLFPEYISTLFYLIDGFLLVILVCWLTASLIDDRQRQWQVTWPITLACAALVLLALASISWALAVPVAAAAALRLLAMFGLFLYIQNEIKDYRPVALAFGAGALAQAVLALLQFLAKSPLGLFSLGEMRWTLNTPGASVLQVGAELWLRGYGLSPSPNIVGQFLAVGLLAWLGWQVGRKQSRPMLWLGVVALVTAGLFSTFSRSAWLGFSLGFILLSGLARFWSGRSALRRTCLYMGAVGLGVGLAFLFIYPQLFAARLGTPLLASGQSEVTDAALSSDLAGNSLELSNLSQRSAHEQSAWAIIARYPLAGVGMGNSPLAASLQGPPPFGERSHQPVHNVLLLLTSELGPLGGAAWLSIWIVLFLGVWQNRKQVAQATWLATWSAAALAVFVFSQFDHSLFTYQQGRSLIWIVLGLWASAAAGQITWRWPVWPRVPVCPVHTRNAWPGLVAVFPALALAGRQVYAHLIHPRGPFFWDPAGFSLSGLQVLQAIQDGRLGKILTLPSQPVTYPPVHSLILALCFALFGTTSTVARLLSLACLLAAAVLVYWIAWLAGGMRWTAGILAVAIFLTAPTILYLAGDALLEAPGALLTVATLGCYIWATAHSGGTSWKLLAAAGLFSTLTFLTKYNYGLPLLAALWLVTLFAEESWGSRSRKLAVLAVTTLLPLLLWFVTDPDGRLGGFVTFASNRSSGLGLVQELLFYPLALPADYAAHWLIGVGVLAAAVFAVRRYREAPVQLLLVFVLAGLAMVVIHPFKQARFLYTVFPAIAILAGVEIAGLASHWPRKGLGRWLGLGLTVGVILLAGLGLPARLQAYRDGDNERLNYEPATTKTAEEMIAFVQAGVDPAEGVFFNGGFNEFSEVLLRWRWESQRQPTTRLYGLPYLGPDSRSGRIATTSPLYIRQLERELAEKEAAAVVDVTMLPESNFYTPDYQSWNAWQAVYSQAIIQEPKLFLEREAWFDSGTVRVAIYRYRPADSSLPTVSGRP